MNKHSEFERLKSTFSLKDADFYFLELIPLIKVIWSDGKNQQAELQILYKFVVEHISRLDQLAGIRVVTSEQANDFLDRFAHQQPDAQLLNELEAFSTLHNKNQDPSRSASVLDYCLDIAAACTNKYPYDMHERIMHEEKVLLKTLFKELNVQDDLTHSAD